MGKTQDLSRQVIAALRGRRSSNGTIPAIGSVELLESLGYQPSHYAVALGQAASLLDAACLIQHLPWLGRLVVFGGKRPEFEGVWAPWAPHMATIIEAPAIRSWSDQDLVRVSTGLPHVGAAKWWQDRELQSSALLQEALIAAQQP